MVIERCCTGLGDAARWKGNLQQHAHSLFRNRAADLQALVYGNAAASTQVRLCTISCRNGRCALARKTACNSLKSPAARRGRRG